MIINFSVKNFGSIKEKQTLSFEANKSKHLEKHFISELPNGMRLLKLALIYGSNASGKTMVINALNFLRDLVLEPVEKKTDSLEFEPFLFDNKTPSQNSNLSIEFVNKGTKYSYEVEFSKTSIVNEKLDYFNPKKANIYTRVTDVSKQLTKITFGSKVKTDKTFAKTLESNTLWNNTVLGGFLKTNIELKQLKEVTDWFNNYLKPPVYPETRLVGFVTTEIEKLKIRKLDVINILKKADFNISDIRIQENEEDVPEGFIEFIEKQIKTTDREVDEIRKTKKIKTVNIDIGHTINDSNYYLPLYEESRGTQRYYGLAGLLVLLIKDSVVIPIDELEASLHPELYQHYLLSFIMNSKNSQLIATTHNREILDNKDIFRDDTIWITDKKEDCATTLYSLADFDSSVIRDTTNRLNAYKSGKLGGVPNLSDYYIELEK
jgi:hypothetical protein